ncbi:MAG: RdgB/HAM1 family non-canonical purine NTP pyrophosphatase [Oscillospiraceae bacterium]|jgi:XTP/dITP diphosphohydrolase|nr:RdgB/HAM1 family non-canonical purine NTP pyrophosphatase [Oscillospiraceae bacterium]
MADLIFATGNPHKLREMQTLLAPLGVTLRLPGDWGPFDPAETGDTFYENARIKAAEALRLTGRPALADDSGLAVDALGGAPGVRSARYGGEGLSANERNALLLGAMADADRRAARFVCALVCLFPDGRELYAQGICEGEIARSPQGESGFGYDPVFLLPQRGRTMAQLSEAEKNQISHRGRAVSAFLRLWKEANRETFDK